MNRSKTENYLALLAIRLAGRRRDTIILGGIFMASVISMGIFGLFGQISGRSLYLIAPLIVITGMGYLTTWVKSEIIRGTIEMLNNIMEEKS